MDAAGLAFGVLSAFNVIVEDIRLIRDGQHCGEDIETAKIQLQLVETRVVRWGEAVGIADLNPNVSRTLEHLEPEQDRKTAVTTLGVIRHHMDSAKKKLQDEHQKQNDPDQPAERRLSLARLVHKSKPAETTSAPSSGVQDENDETLVAKFSRMSLERHRRTSMVEKAKWVLWKKGELNELLNKINDLLESLEKLFEATHPKLRALAEAEVASLSEALRTSLRGFLEKRERQDALLMEALKGGPSGGTATGNRSGHFINSGTNHGIQSTSDINFSGGTWSFRGGGGGR